MRSLRRHLLRLLPAQVAPPETLAVTFLQRRVRPFPAPASHRGMVSQAAWYPAELQYIPNVSCAVQHAPSITSSERGGDSRAYRTVGTAVLQHVCLCACVSVCVHVCVCVCACACA
jgi:hypothetical protein